MSGGLWDECQVGSGMSVRWALGWVSGGLWDECQVGSGLSVRWGEV